MFFIDIGELKGVRVAGKKVVEFISFSSEEEIYALTEEKVGFFPDVFSLDFKFFDLPFGGSKAKSAIEIEILSELEEEKEKRNENYIIYTQKKRGTSFAIIYNSLIVQNLFDKGFSTILFKPVVFLSLSSLVKGDGVFVEVGKDTFSFAFSENSFLRFGSFAYSDQEDIKYFCNLILSFFSPEKRENLKFFVFGSRYEIFPFQAQVLTPRDIFQVDFDDPSFTSLCIASMNKFPQVKVSAKKEIPKIETFLRNSLPYSIMSFLTVLFLSIPNFFEIRGEKKKQEFIRSQMESVFKEVFPDAKVVDPFEQMKMEYSKLKNANFASAFLNFYDFSRKISDYVVRIEDFSSDGNEITAELKIKEISYVEKIRESLSDILDDLKVTSTVRSRDGQYFIMRIAGSIKSSKQKIKKKRENESRPEEVL
jgi:hypothetical protein